VRLRDDPDPSAASRLELDQALGERDRDELRLRVNVELVHRVAQMSLNRRLADEQLSGDLASAAAQRDQSNHFALTGRQRRCARPERRLPAAHRPTIQLEHDAKDEIAAGDNLAVRSELHPQVTAVATDQLPSEAGRRPLA
jgi:hypothetical protein